MVNYASPGSGDDISVEESEDEGGAKDKEDDKDKDYNPDDFVAETGRRRYVGPVLLGYGPPIEVYKESSDIS
ncbi:hypothetical protein D9758_013652 [Tetrapyrgos nigripes]|uniref:Uncharacterized protein n=1 Tax=Tetrapyrgos nigripes TaxID=182062 RepID=A0A8H5CQA8_9AGAR|nr:hypothetical protein D9758_013652 [Tetrapyrgos nigripes]